MANRKPLDPPMNPTTERALGAIGTVMAAVADLNRPDRAVTMDDIERDLAAAFRIVWAVNGYAAELGDLQAGDDRRAAKAALAAVRMPKRKGASNAGHAGPRTP